MKVELISIGDELLIGQTVNTNASWLGEQFSKKGFSVDSVAMIKDDESAIRESILLAESRAEIIIITGGLGPTKDDITKKVLCDYFDTKLVQNEEVLKRVKDYFDQRGRVMLEVNIQQAWLPENATILPNYQGTASGMLFESEGRIVVSLPGVPYEMKHLMEAQVFPFLQKRFKPKSYQYKTLSLQGIGESYIADRIAEIEDEVRALGFGLAYLPKPGLVRIRISASSGEENRIQIEKFLKRIEVKLARYAFGYDDDSIEEVVGKLLKAQKSTVGTVESCTGGMLSARMVQVAGASEYVMGAMLSYSNALKEKLADVSPESIAKHGAVSLEVVEQMAVNGRDKLGVDYCMATSGIAGPDGGSTEKPVGTVCIAVAGPECVISQRFLFGNDRKRNIEMTVLTALNLLRCEILQINIEKS